MSRSILGFLPLLVAAMMLAAFIASVTAVADEPQPESQDHVSAT